EPERHLHPAITGPLLTAIFAERVDCPFIISTHELSLIEQSPAARISILNGCQWDGGGPNGFDIDLLEPGEDFPSDVRLAILGGRRKILFVEGDARSLDNRLYSLLFPSVTVICREGVRNVVNGVNG